MSCTGCLGEDRAATDCAVKLDVLCLLLSFLDAMTLADLIR